MSERRKTIVIAGLGDIGEHLAAAFVQKGQDVIVVDVSQERLSSIQTVVEARTVHGHAASGEVLRRIGMESVDLFVACTGLDGVNVVAALKARAMGARRTVAIVEEVEYFDDNSGIYKGWLGMDLALNTRYLVAREIHKLVTTGGAIAVQDFAENRVEMAEFRVFADTPIAEMALNQAPLPRECLVVAIRRGQGLVIPRGNDVIHVGDEILVIGKTEKVAELGEILGRRNRGKPRVIVMGGGMVGFVLVRTLLGFADSIVLIERDKTRCDFLACELPGEVTVLHGDGTNAALLKEEGISECEVFAAVSGDEERNIIAARLAKELGAERCIALVSRPYYVDVCRHLGLEVVPGPAQIVAREIVKSMMVSGILSETLVMDGAATFIEVLVPAGAPVSGKAVQDAKLPRNCIVCALIEGSKVTIPRGDTIIEAGMRAVIFADPLVRPELARMFKA